MKKHKSIYKFLTVLLTVSLTLQSLPEINHHSHSTGLSNFHSYCPKGITCCFGAGVTHMIYECGKTFHL